MVADSRGYAYEGGGLTATGIDNGYRLIWRRHGPLGRAEDERVVPRRERRGFRVGRSRVLLCLLPVCDAWELDVFRPGADHKIRAKLGWHRNRQLFWSAIRRADSSLLPPMSFSN